MVGLSDPAKALLFQEMRLMGGLIGGSEKKNNSLENGFRDLREAAAGMEEW